MKTIVINLFGAPGAGKSTGAAYIFALLKMAGIEAELVTEFAKDITRELENIGLHPMLVGGALIGAGIGAAVGTGAGVLIGKKMDKAKAAAEAVANAQVETTTDKNGLEAVKVTFDNGILFKVGKSDLQAGAQSSLRQFANNVLNVYTDCDVAIYGFASSDGSDATNLTLSQNRANAVRSFLTGNCGVSNTQIKSTTGYGEDPNYLVYDANGKEDRNASRRVEVYLYASEAMINAANAGTLQ